MKKFILFIIIITCSFVIPYFFHMQVYRFYLKLYYSHMYQGDEYMDKAQKLYDSGQYQELKDFLEPLLLVYRDDNKIKRLAGMNLIKLGNELEGAELYTSGMEEGYYNDYEASKVIKILFYKECFGDIIYYYDRKILREHRDISFYYGVSLLKSGRMDEAYTMLINAEKNGYSDSQKLFYYLALVLEADKKDKEAAEYLLKAYGSSGPDNREVVNALVRVYNNLKMFDKAEMLLRKKKD